jgi:hypothetical protein
MNWRGIGFTFGRGEVGTEVIADAKVGLPRRR